ncbi:hypothetical protein GCM10027294_49890 [Marinactinospora endophytica]
MQCGRKLDVPARGRKPLYCSRSCQAHAYRARARARMTEGDPSPPQPTAVEEGEGEGEDRPATRQGGGQKSEGLSLQVTVQAAMEIADAEGLDGLSMRKVAAHLGVATMSLYHYVASKDELIDLMVEAVFSEGEQGLPEATDWRTGLEAAARWEWALYSRHPWSLQVMASVHQPLVPSLLTYGERVRSLLDGHGLDPVTSHRLVLSVDSLVHGLAMLRVSEIEALRRGPDSVSEFRSVKVPAALKTTADVSYPRLAALRNHEEVVEDLDGLFEFCLSRALDGVALFLERERSAEPVHSPADPSPEGAAGEEGAAGPRPGRDTAPSV